MIFMSSLTQQILDKEAKLEILGLKHLSSINRVVFWNLKFS